MRTKAKLRSRDFSGKALSSAFVWQGLLGTKAPIFAGRLGAFLHILPIRPMKDRPQHPSF